MLIFGDMLGCKAQQRIDIITGFLWRFSQFRDTYKEKHEDRINDELIF